MADATSASAGEPKRLLQIKGAGLPRSIADNYRLRLFW
jgi:hypothetical protein